MHKLIMFIGAWLSILHLAIAQETEGTTRGELTSEGMTKTTVVGFAPYLGINAGYTDQARGSQSEGLPSSIKLLGSYYLEKQTAVFDLGYGVQNQQFSRERALEESHNAGTLEVAARYLFPEQWQGGIVYNQFFGAGPNYDANQGDAQFVGLQVLKEFSFGIGYLARAGARVMTDVNVDGETVNMMMLDFQLGWNPGSFNKATIKSDAARASSFPTRGISTAEGSSVDIVTHFETNSAELSPEQVDYLKRLGAELADHPNLVQEVHVTGHTDSVGDDAVNVPLSEKRAKAVGNILESEMGDAATLTVRGFSDLKPVSSSREENRRAEIEFIGVTNPEQLTEVLDSLQGEPSTFE